LRIETLRLTGLVAAIIVTLLLLIFLQRGFTPLEYCTFNIEETSISVEEDVGRGVGQVLWGERQLDMIGMGFLLFVTATGCISVLRIEREES